MVNFTTKNKHAHNIKFSPSNSLLAVVSNEQFGLSGSGTLFILHLNENGRTIQEIQHQWINGLFDLCWSSAPNSNHILTGSGDGALQIWASTQEKPIASFLGHDKEISSVNWKNGEFDSILSASWDQTIKIWNPIHYKCLTAYLDRSGPILEAKFSPHIPNIIASVSVDGTLKLWSTLNSNCLTSFRVHDAAVLSCDWSKYHDNIIATSGSDSFIRCWDIRHHGQPLFQIKGGSQPIKQIRFSPHFPHILASASLDWSTQIWDIKQNLPLEVFQHHSGFVYGLDWNSRKIGELADCSWDSTIQIFQSQAVQNLKNKM